MPRSIRHPFLPQLGSLALTALGLALPALAQQPLPLTTAAATGTFSGSAAYPWAPKGVPDGIAFDGSRLPAPPIINNAGDVAFSAPLIGAVTSGATGNDEGLWAGQPQSTSLAARRGSPPLGVSGGVVYDGLMIPGRMTLARSIPRIAFIATLRGTGVTPANNLALWAGAYLDKPLIARTGSPVPTLPGTAISSLNDAGTLPPLLNDSGTVITKLGWPATGGGGGTAYAVQRWSTFVSTLIAQSGQAAPGLTGATLGELSPTGLNGADAVAFAATALGPDAAQTRTADFEFSSPTLQFVAASDSGPLTPVSLGGTGRIAMLRTLRPGSKPVPTLLAGLPGIVKAVLRVGDPAPLIPGAVTIAALDPRVVTNQFGQVALSATLTGDAITPANDRVIYLWTAGLFQIVARSGDPAASFPGVTLAMPGTDLAINNAGQIALRTGLAGPGVIEADNAAWWIWSPAAGLTLVSREGQNVTVANGDARLVAELPTAGRWSNTDSGAPSFFNDSGAMVYLARMSVGWVIGIAGIATPSQTGACCTGVRCVITSPGSCTGNNRRYLGPATPCNASGNVAAPCCRADFNHDDLRQPSDIFAYLNAYFAVQTQADYDSSGTLEPADIFAFLNAFFAGGC